MDQFKEFFNFDNVGSKIKNFTKWACWISIIVVWVAAAAGFIYSLYYTSQYRAIGIGVLSVVGGVVLTFLIWISSWSMYGFGEIVENNTKEEPKKVESTRTRIEGKSKPVTPQEKEKNRTYTNQQKIEEKIYLVDRDLNLILEECCECGKIPLITYHIEDEKGQEHIVCKSCLKNHQYEL